MKETEGYIEKERKYRDRSKKKRLTVEQQRERAEADERNARHPEPYHRKKDWMQLPASDEDWYEEPGCVSYEDDSPTGEF